MTTCLPSSMHSLRVKTPCIGVCSTGIGGNVCRGCKRFAYEVVQWNGYGEAEKAAVINRLSSLLVQVMREKIDIFDVNLLSMMLNEQRVRFLLQADPYAWVFDLLKVGAGQIDNLERFGCRVRAGSAHADLVQLRDEIDHDFFVLSSAHFDKYFNRIR